MRRLFIPHSLTAEQRSKELGRLRLMAHAWDELIRLPVLGRSVGLDAVVGVVPGVGDVAGALVASWALVVAARIRAPMSVVLRMVFNIAVDALLGAIPLLGDLFDIGWHAQRRNVMLLERWIESPAHVARRSSLTLMGVGILIAGVLAAALWLAVRLIGWMIALV